MEEYMQELFSLQEPIENMINEAYNNTVTEISNMENTLFPKNI